MTVATKEPTLIEIPRSDFVALIEKAIFDSGMPEEEAELVRAEARDRDHFIWGDVERGGHSCPLHAAGIWQRYDDPDAQGQPAPPVWFNDFWNKYDSAVNSYLEGKGVDYRFWDYLLTVTGEVND